MHRWRVPAWYESHHSRVVKSSQEAGIDLSAIAGLQAMPGFLAVFGFPDPTNPLGYGINTTVQQLISSLMSLGAFVGGALSGPISRFFNRRIGVLIAVVFNHVGVIIMILATTTSTLYAGRFITGIANGILNTIPQLYVHEASTAHQRGGLISWYLTLTQFGFLIGTVVDNYTAPRLDKTSYQIPLATFFIAPTLVALFLPWLPESPRWLIESGSGRPSNEFPKEASKSKNSGSRTGSRICGDKGSNCPRP